MANCDGVLRNWVVVRVEKRVTILNTEWFNHSMIIVYNDNDNDNDNDST